ncbi:helix-turn-helix domain-containing protein [Bacillus thuringiensis]|jgi:transcriptional regulator with XRE-family HTH domain|nr:helix-turn-helix transcriptional regulator [Bacillus thuringiensis]
MSSETKNGRRTLMLYLERISQNLSIRKISEKLGINVEVFRAIEKGQSGVNAGRARKIADLLNKPINHLFEPTYYKVKK